MNKLCPYCFSQGRIKRLTTDTLSYWCQYCHGNWKTEYNLYVTWLEVTKHFHGVAKGYAAQVQQNA